jgi:hypothetical protein
MLSLSKGRGKAEAGALGCWTVRLRYLISWHGPGVQYCTYVTGVRIRTNLYNEE